MTPPLHGQLFAPLPAPSGAEWIERLPVGPGVRIERIVSHGQASPPGFWYDQPESEWVVVLAGSATLAFADGSRLELAPGDWVSLPPHCRHRVERTDTPTVWLAVFAPAA